ncbi:metallophosphoesterase [Stylonychia lemnae]|uniref:Metallophosphoesterase n=1 Tax=Stylonychia lemnae TaxID=5949 RepID=A0A078BAI9_STYLE|nr:metallophosphoesterase [Stylonychia lemnae]|eukprot:CDW91575.1 metallophosphoesterase [Stylonychia lemnae]
MIVSLIVKNILTLGILLLFGFQLSSAYTLKFNEAGKFKIVQLTDIHLGYDDEKDQKSLNVISTVLDHEKPDLVFITGDAVSGYLWDDQEQNFYASKYQKMAELLTKYQIPWALTAGNHDSEGDLTRDQISEFDRSFALSLTQQKIPELSHTFNYQLPVYDKNGESVLFRIWTVDSGEGDGCPDGFGYDCVRNDQIDWMRQELNQLPDEDPSKRRGILFMHIPIQEYMNLYNDENIYGEDGEYICCQSVNTGLFQLIQETNAVDWISSGHDHDNDYYGQYKGINMAYGRKTGYGQYGPNKLLRGARVFEISINNEYDVKTWIRQEDGSIDYQKKLSQKPFLSFSQEYCCEEIVQQQLYNFKYTIVFLIGMGYFLIDSLLQRRRQRSNFHKEKLSIMQSQVPSQQQETNSNQNISESNVTILL